ncbi:unnamed protein product [Rotaria sp. Silwood2]|nr:unnamed protein product [Rotaria sp. Silwood2]
MGVLINQNSALRQHNSNLFEELDRLRLEIVQQINYVQLLQKNICNLATTNDELTNQLNGCQQEISSLKKENDHLKQTLNNVQKENDHLKQALNNLQKDYDQVTQTLNNLQKENDHIKKQLNNLQKENDRDKEENKRFKNI